MAENNSKSLKESSDIISALEDDDNASVDSEQLIADIDEFISESTETELDCENEKNVSDCGGMVLVDKPTTSAEAGSSQAGKSSDYISEESQMKYPVVLLSKLNPQDIAQYGSGENNDKKVISCESDPRKLDKSSEVSKSVWCDDVDGSLSELSVSDFSLSDIEDDALPIPATKPKQAETTVDSKVKQLTKNVGQVDGRRNSKEAPASSQTTNSKSQQSHHSKSKSICSASQPKDNGKSHPIAGKNSVTFKDKPDSSCKTITNPGNNKPGKQAVEQKENLRKEDESLKQTERSSLEEISKEWRYELVLTNFNILELTNESFRKFINLASDCAMDISRPIASDKPSEGAVSLFFGDFAAIQSAMQKLGQVSFTSTKKIQGVIIGRQMMPLSRSSSALKANSSQEWKCVNHVKMSFTLYTAWTEKLKQVVQMKDWKKADKSHEKLAKIQRVPTPVSNEFLSVLFPFSINILPSPNSQNATEKMKKGQSFYPVNIKYASQELMETVLGCFQDLSVIFPSALVPQTKLYVANVKPKIMPPGHKDMHPLTMQPYKHEYTRQGRLFSCKHNRGQQLKQQQHHQHHQHQGRDRKRSLSATEERLPGKRSRFSQQEDKSKQPTAAVNTGDSASDMSVKKMAEDQGLDPNNSDVLCLLELQMQLNSMQSLMAVPAPTSQSLDHPSVKTNTEGNIEENEIAEAEQKLRESIALRQKQLHELEEKLKASKKKSQQSKQDGVSVKQAYNSSPAGPAPLPYQNDQPLDFNKPLPKVELAVKADEMRSMTKPAEKNPTSSFKKPLPKASAKAEDCALPLEFGKNVAKVSPKVMGWQTSDTTGSSDKLLSQKRLASKEGVSRQQKNHMLLKSRENPQKRTRISRWSSEDDGDSSRIRRGNDVLNRQLGMGVLSHQGMKGMNKEVLGDGLLPTPGSSIVNRSARDAWPSNSKDDMRPKVLEQKAADTRKTLRDDRRRKFTEEKVVDTGRNLTNRNIDAFRREESPASNPWSQRKTGEKFYEDQESRRHNENFYPSNFQDLESQKVHTYPPGTRRGSSAGHVTGSGGAQGSPLRARGPSRFSQVEHKELTIIERLQKDALEKNSMADNSWKDQRGQGQIRSQEQSRISGIHSELHSYEADRGWEDYGMSQYGWEKQSKTNVQSTGRIDRMGYGGVKGERKPVSAGRGFDSQSTSHRNEETNEMHYQGSFDFHAQSETDDSGGIGGRNRKDWHCKEYDDCYEDSSEQGYDGSGRRQNSGNPMAAKRQKLDQYCSRDDAGQMMTDEWNRQDYGGSGRGSFRGTGRVSGGRGRGIGEMHKSDRVKDSARDSNLYDIEKEQLNEYGRADGSANDGYDEGKYCGFEGESYGSSISKGREIDNGNRGGTGGLRNEIKRGGRANLRGILKKDKGFGARSREGMASGGFRFQDADQVDFSGSLGGKSRERGSFGGNEDVGHYEDGAGYGAKSFSGDGRFDEVGGSSNANAFGIKPLQKDERVFGERRLDGSRIGGSKNPIVIRSGGSSDRDCGGSGRSSSSDRGRGDGYHSSFGSGSVGGDDRGYEGFGRSRDGHSFGSSDRGSGSIGRGRGGNSFGSSDRGGGGSSFGSSGRGRGGSSFGSSGTGGSGNSFDSRGDSFGSGNKAASGSIFDSSASSFGSSGRGRGANSFGSSDRGGGGSSFGSSGRGRGANSFGSSDRGGGGSSFGSSGRGRGGNSFGSSDRGGGGSSFGSSGRGRGGNSFGSSDRGGGGSSFGSSGRGRGGNSFGSSDRGGGGSSFDSSASSFGSSGRGRGAISFGSSDRGGGGSSSFGSGGSGHGSKSFGGGGSGFTNTDRNHDGSFGRTDRGHGGEGFDGNDGGFGGGVSVFGSTDRSHDGNFGRTDKGRGGKSFGGNDGNFGGGGSGFGNADRGHDGSFGAGGSSFGSSDNSRGRSGGGNRGGRSSSGRGRGRGSGGNNGFGNSRQSGAMPKLPVHEKPGLLGSIPNFGGQGSGDKERKEFVGTVNSGVNFY